METVSSGMHTLDHVKHLLASLILLLAGGRFDVIPGIVTPAQDEHQGSNQRHHDQSKPHHGEPGHSEYHIQPLNGFIGFFYHPEKWDRFIS